MLTCLSGLFGNLAKLPPAQQGSILGLQKAFLEFRRFLLKASLIEEHVKSYGEVQEILPDIQKLEQERKQLQVRTIKMEAELRALTVQYYKSSETLAQSTLEMLKVLELMREPLQEIFTKLSEIYKTHANPDNIVPQAALEESKVLCNNYRKTLSLLEDSLVLHKPLIGSIKVAQEKKESLEKEVSLMKDNVSKLEEQTTYAKLDCQTLNSFSEKTGKIGEILKEMYVSSTALVCWMENPESPIYSGISEKADELKQQTQPLQNFRDQNFLELLAEQENEEIAMRDLELNEEGSLAYVSPSKMVELIVSGKCKAYSHDFPKIFIYTFRQFMQPIELLEKLVLIYCTTPPEDELGPESRQLAPCRLRILNGETIFIIFFLLACSYLLRNSVEEVDFHSQI